MKNVKNYKGFSRKKAKRFDKTTMLKRRLIMKIRNFLVYLIGIVLAISLAVAVSPVCAAAAKKKELILATTTSTRDSGLLDVLIPIFERETGYQVKIIASESGQAMAIGKKGEADVLLVHSPEAETSFMAEGNGRHRRLVMHNDFIIVGPPDDPVTVKMSKSVREGFKKISLGAALFLSPDDHSEIHSKEKSLWRSAGISPEGQRWYRQTGLDLRQTLNAASKKKAYCLADRETYLALKNNLGLDILLAGDPLLLNVYHVIEVNAAKWPNVNAPGARAFSDFMVSKQTQKIIGTFGVDKYGTSLFFPDAGKKLENLGE